MAQKQGAMRQDLQRDRDEHSRRLPDGYLAPPALASPPRRKPPAGAIDCHAHVFGPFDQFPLAPNRPYTPAELPGPRYLAMLDQVGLANGVLVQGAAHGLDCSAMFNALDRSNGRLRGIALAGPDASDAALEHMSQRGVLGLRFSRPPKDLGPSPVDFGAFPYLAPRIKELRWHAQVQTDCRHFAEIAEELLAWDFPIVLDHMCLVDPTVTDARDLGVICDLLREGRIWLKLTPYRMARQFPDYGDMRRFHDAFVAANPKRLLWGSDWPHVHMRENMPEEGRLLDLLQDWVGDDEIVRQILVDNPRALYGFDR